jgi:localization factor PodJL
MKPGIPWSVKGIDTEAREAAKHAARRSGMTLGEWLNTVIREQAEEAEPPARSAMHDIESKLDHLSEQLARMARRGQDTTAGGHYGRTPPGPEQSLAHVLARVEDSERQAGENFAQPGGRLETLGDKLNRGLDSLPRNPGDVPGYHDRLLANSPLIARLENRIADLTRRMADKEEVIREDFRKLVQGEFGKLTARIDSAKQAAEAYAQRAQAQAVQLAQKDLRDFEGRMENVLKAAHAPQEIIRLSAEMNSLGQRVDDLRTEAASERDLRSLRVVIEQLSARVAQGPDLRPLADLGRRLAEIGKWLEQGRGDHVGNQIADLEQRVFELDKQIAQSIRQEHAAPDWAGVERELAGLSDRLAHTEQQLRHIATLEQPIHRLYQNMERNRNSERDVAEEAASRMASRLMQDWPGTAPRVGPSPELQALENALETVRTNYKTVEQRNQEALAAVHETLEQIINRLTEIERFRSEPESEAEPVRASCPEIAAVAEGAQSWPDFRNGPDLDTCRSLDPPSSPEPAPAIEDDFIAAARRAAQAAVQQTPGPSAPDFHNRQTLGSRATSLFALHRREEPVQTANAVVSTPKNEDPDKRRRRVLIGIVLLAAVSALAYNNFVREPDGVPSPPAQLEEPRPSTGSSSPLDGMGQTDASARQRAR